MVFGIRSSVHGALLVALLLGIAGCGGDEDKTASPGTPTSAGSSTSPTPTGATGTETPGVQVTGSNPGLPTDFPTAAVPLLAGAVELPVGQGSGTPGKRGWILELKLAEKADACFEAAEAALIGGGFTKQPGERKNDGIREAQYTAPGWVVIISVSASDSGGCRLDYEVGEIAEAPSQ